MRRIGLGLSVTAILFLLFDSTGKVLRVPPVVAGTLQLGYPDSVIRTLGVAQLVGVVLYAVPRASVWGALLLTGYLGGAVASHVRIGSPLFTHVLFPVYVAFIAWAGLALRNAKLRHLLAILTPTSKPN